MEDFNTDESQIEDPSIDKSQITLGDDTPNKNSKGKSIPITSKRIETFKPEYQGEKPDFTKLEPSEHDIDIQGATKDDYENYGNIYGSDNIDRMRGEYQSNFDRLGNLGARVVSNIVGGTISSFGSVAAIAQGVNDEIQGKDAEFSNSVTELGQGIKDWARENFPNYKENPKETWNLSDPAFWFDGVESAASTLEFMLGSNLVMKGVGAAGKLLKAESLLAKVGINSQKLAFGAKVAAGAGFARNAENMMESFQLVKDTKANLINEWEKNPDIFENLKDSDIAKELAKEGREVNKENLSSFIAGKAGWEAYGINSLNIGFDALQLTPLLKGFNPSTRLGRLATNSKIIEANRAASGIAKAASRTEKIFDILNPAISGLGRSLSEGVEEMVNYGGTLRGKNLVNRVTGKPEENVNLGELTESAFWGTLGGAVFEGVSHLANKKESNIQEQNRLAEIHNRTNVLNDSSKAIKDINDREDLTDIEKKDAINDVKAELDFDMALRWHQVGNGDLGEQWLKSKDLRDKYLELGIAEEGDVDKAIAKSVDNSKIVENAYKNYYNTFQLSDARYDVKNYLINQSTLIDYFIKKNEQKRNKLATELEDLKANDVVFKSSNNPNLESSLELEGLKVARKGINQFTNQAENTKGQEILSIKGKSELEKIDNKIKELQSQIGTNKVDLTEVNPDIIAKQARISLIDGINNIQSAKTNEFKKPETATKVQDNFDKVKKEQEEKHVEEFRKNVEEANPSEEQLNDLTTNFDKNSKETEFLNDKIEQIKLKKERENKINEVTNDLNSPVNNSSKDEFEGLPLFDIQDLDETKVSPSWKQIIDKTIDDRDINQLQGFTSDALSQSGNSNEVIYTRNKIQSIRNKNSQIKETKELNTKNPEPEFNEFAFDEFNQDDTSSTIININDLDSDEVKEDKEILSDNKFEYLSKDISENYIRSYIPIFGYGLRNFGYKSYFNVDRGNIKIKSEYIDLIKTLMDPKISEGTELDIIWDKGNSFTKARGHNGDVFNEAFKIVYKGITIGYLPTKATTEAEIKKYLDETYTKNDKIVDRLNFELPETIALRSKLSLDDKIYKVKILKKGNGSLFSSGRQHSIKGIGKGFYALDSRTTIDKFSLINIQDEKEVIINNNPLKSGTIYRGIEDANGQIIPVPLKVNKINDRKASNISKNINSLLDLLNDNKNTENQDVRDIKDEIGKYIRVDRSENYNKEVGFRVYPMGTNKDGTTTDSRIEIGYRTIKGDKRIAVLKKSLYNGQSWMGIFDPIGNKLFDINSDDDTFKSSINDILKLKYHNIDFNLLNKNKAFKDINEEYKSYEDYLVDQEILQTDLGQVLDSKGNKISDLFGFDNDFTLAISSELVNEENIEPTKEANVVSEISDLFLIDAYEKELKAKDSITNDLSYRNNYSLYKDSVIDGSTALSDILKNPLNNNIRVVATWLQSNISKFNPTIQLSNTISGNGNASFSNNKGILISKSKSFSEVYLQQTILHELIHAATQSSLLKYVSETIETNNKLRTEYEPTDLSQIKFKTDTPIIAKNFVNQILNLRNSTIDQLSKKYGKQAKDLAKGNLKTFYGLENPFEFISEIMVNPNFRNEVKSLTGNQNVIQKIYNLIIDFLNKIFGTNLNKLESSLLKDAVNLIKNFVDTSDDLTPLSEKDIVSFSKLDEFDNKFSREDIIEINNTFEGIISSVLQRKKIDIFGEDISLTSNSNIRSIINSEFSKYLELSCPESCKNKVSDIENYFDSFYNNALRGINKNFKIGDAYDIEQINENDAVNKNWDDTADNQISSQNNVTKQIKLFIKTVPQLDSSKVNFKEDGTPIWNRKKSTITGMSKYIDFNVIYPYMVRNLIGARSHSEIIERLNDMSKINPSFSYIAFELQKDSNLLAQFESNLAKKTIYDSYVTFINNKDEGKEIWIQDELKSGRYDIKIANDWTEKVNTIVDNLSKDKNFILTNESLYNRILLQSRSFEDNKSSILQSTWDLANNIGIDLSYASIQNSLDNSRSFQDFEIAKTLGQILGSIKEGKKNNDNGRILSLAKLETLYRFDIVENSGLDISGNLIYSIRNSSFITNWFNDLKSQTKEDREENENYLKDISKVPELQMSSWLWSTDSKPGILNYEIKDNIKVPLYNKDGSLNINKSFVDKFNFHSFGGAKELITKKSQKYSEAGDNDTKLVNLIGYLNLNDKRKGKESEYVLIPSIIASDSGQAGWFEVPKIKLNKSELIGSSISRDSDLFKGVYNTVRGEVRRIQQNIQNIFNVDEFSIYSLKDNIDIEELQQYYHYGKEMIYDENGEINIKKSLLDDKGFPKGKAFYFQNMSIKEGDKYITLNDIIPFGHIVLGAVDSEIQNKIKNFVDKFIQQQIQQGISDYRSVETEIAGKHKNIVDGSFKGLVAEYVLNHFIANNEQFLLFNGSITEYKDKIDTNKRAKQLFTPGVGLSTEAMKITYENGSQSDGVTFKAITIKDIKTKSHTIDFIVNTIKKQIVKEKNYTKSEIDSFSLQGAKKDSSKNKLEQDVHKIISGYLAINAGDAQGYSTLDRWEMIKRGRGEFNSSLESLLPRLRKGENISLEESRLIEPVKGYYYGRDYDSKSNKLTSTQIKYSCMPLIPSMVTGTELETLMNYMNKNAIDEAFFESAHKVGAKAIYKIANEDGVINKSVLSKSIPNKYLNKNYKIQLDTSEHLVDEENLLAVQISKLIMANIDPNISYNVGGKDYNKEGLIKHYFNIWNQNIESSAIDLLDKLGVQSTEDGFIVSDKDIKEILIQEINKRGLSDNYSFAIELDERGNFKLPLFINNMSTKWESILTSLFTNNVTKQKLPGGSAVLGSRLFLDKSIEQSGNTIQGIQWSKDKESDKTLKSFFEKDGKTQVVEVLLGGWNSSLYKDGQLMNIDEIPDEAKTMIGYRIPTTSKSYMTVFKVVGFLPEEAKGLVITPDDMITQMGQDFDIDKWFLINKEFYRTKKGKFIIPKYSSKKEFDILQEEVKEMRGDLYAAGNDLITRKLADDLAKAYGLATTDDLEAELKDKEERLKELGEYNEEGDFIFRGKPSKAARNNEIFDIYHSVLTNPAHYKEILTPSGYPNIIELSDKLDEIFNQNDNNINPLTEQGQRTFKKRNIGGKSLLGIAANLNGFMAIAQVSKMEFENKLAFKFKYDINKYDIKVLKDRYGNDLEIKDNYIHIDFKKLGYAPDNSYLNINGELIMEVGAEAVNAAADNAKDPRLEKINLSSYTYPLYHAGVSSGVDAMTMGMFIRQPIIKNLNDFYFDNKSLLNDENGKQIETVKRFYQTQLYIELRDQGKLSNIIKIINDKIQDINNQIKNETSELKIKDLNIKLKKTTKKLDDIKNSIKKAEKKIDRRVKENIVGTYDTNHLIYIDREDTKEILQYNPDELDYFSQQELEEQLEFKAKEYKNLSKNNKLKYLKTQLQIIEYFNRWNKNGQAIQDMARVVKTDGLGAGPSMDTTSRLIRDIDKLGDNQRILINNEPAIKSIYPSYFNINKESVYSPLESYFKLSNELSVNILSNFFINQTKAFKDIIYSITGSLKRNLNEEELKNINKFLNINLVNDFPDFRAIDKERVLGINKNINLDSNIDFKRYSELSVANKVAIMKDKQKEYLATDSQHILNFLTPILDNVKINENGYHKIDFIFYKNEFTDDNLADSIAKMFEVGDEFEKNLASDLINYSLITNGLTYGLRSFSKVIPTKILYDIGLGSYLKDRQIEFNNNLSGFNIETIDTFFRNNWNNNSIVPTIRTRWDYIKDTNGKKQIKKDSDNQLLTRDKTPIWDSNKKTLTISEKSLRNLPEKEKNAPYISLWTKNGLKLYKKYTQSQLISNEDGSYTEIKKTSFDGNIFYYQVNKLGKDGITEFSSKSLFKENGIQSFENLKIARIQNIIEKIKEMNNKPKTINTSSKTENDLINKCKL